MKLPLYLGLLHRAEETLAASYMQVAAGHGHEPDVHYLCMMLAEQCQGHATALRPVVERYGEQPQEEPERLHAQGLSETRSGAVGLLRDLHDLYTLANFVDVTWMMLKQAAAALRDKQLLGVVVRCEAESAVQLDWLRTRMKQAAPQALIVAE